jgi:phosphatidylglycerophosphatase A
MWISNPGLAVAVCTVGGVGRLRPAPGTWGSLVAAVVAAAGLLTLPIGWHRPALASAILVVTLAGLALAPAAVRRFDDPDPGPIVIDEVAGTWLAIACLPAHALAEPVWGIVLATLLFRVFDIAKPWPVGWCERLPGSLGIMADDLMAGILAGIVATVLLT